MLSAITGDAAVEVRRWLDRRKKSLEDVRRHYEPLWREIRLYFEPSFGRALVDERDIYGRESRRDDDKIINSETRIAVERYSSGMQSGITNKAQSWLSIVPKRGDGEAETSPVVNEWCHGLTMDVIDALERGNFYRSCGQVYTQAAMFGTSVMMIIRGDSVGDVSYEVIDAGDYWIAEDRYGIVNTLMRRMSITVEQASVEFWRQSLPTTWLTMLDDGRYEEVVEIYNIVCPVKSAPAEVVSIVGSDCRYVSIYWAPGDSNQTSGILDIRRYGYKPFSVMRQSNGYSAYGNGIGEKSLPDAKELQELERIMLKMIAYEADPPILAPSTMQHSAINLLPGGVTYYDSVLGGSSPVSRLFETRQGIDKVADYIRVVSDRISRMWYNDLFSMMLSISRGDRQKRTATEIAELAGEKVTLLGPVLTQMDDFLNDVIDATLSILTNDGMSAMPPEDAVRDGVELSVEYTSTIHTEMKASLKMRSVNQLIEVSGMLAQFDSGVIDKIDTDKIVDEVGSVFPGSAAYIVGTDAANQARANRARLQAQQVQQARIDEAAKTAGKNLKDLSEARVGNGNALDALVSGLTR